MADPKLIATTWDAPQGTPREERMIIRDIIWSPDSQRLLVLTSQGLWAAQRPDFKLVQVADNLFMDSHQGWDAQWLP